jgi:hypothetical protein
VVVSARGQCGFRLYTDGDDARLQRSVGSGR